jgi:hypothetical protein
MDHISLYLESFKEKFKSANDAKFLLQIAIREATGIEFPLENISERNGVIKINCDPIEKSVMLERKEKLEKVLKQSLNLSKIKIS